MMVSATVFPLQHSALLVCNTVVSIHMSFPWTASLTDIDECSSDGACDDNAECYNSIPGFHCVCNIGFSGNGLFCEGMSNRMARVLPFTPKPPETV